MASTRTEDHGLVHRGSAHPAKAAKHEVELADDDPRIWGWHHEGDGKTSRIAGIVVVGFILLMMLGNHNGKVEDLWLLAVAGIMLIMIVVSLGNKRKSIWRK